MAYFEQPPTKSEQQLGKSAEKILGTTTEKHPDGKLERYISFRDALESAKRHQPWEDPRNPTAPFANELRIAVLDALKLTSPERCNHLKFYTSVDSVLDLIHGVDAFFEFELEGKAPLRTTLDVTMRPGKDHWKADILFSVEGANVDTLVEDIAQGKYDGLIERLAGSIAYNIREKLKNEHIQLPQIFIPKHLQ